MAKKRKEESELEIDAASCDVIEKPKKNKKAKQAEEAAAEETTPMAGVVTKTKGFFKKLLQTFGLVKLDPHQVTAIDIIDPNAPRAVDGRFSCTMFTERKKSEIQKYKRYLNKMRKGPNSKPIRYNPTAAQGLEAEQVCERVTNGFSNYVQRGSTKTIRRILFTNIFTFFNLLCFVVAGLLIWVGIAYDSGAFKDMTFLIILFLNIFIGIIQEIKAKLTIEKLSLVASTKILCIRGGAEKKLSVDDLVLDDVIILASGQQIPADCIILDGVIEVNESLLTGESNPIQKEEGNTIFGGSFVVSGVCTARMDKIGRESYVQNLAKGASRYVRPKSELLGTLRVLIKSIGIIMVVLSAALIWRQLAGGTNDISSVIRHTAGAIVGMIPSGMFLLTSLALAVGVINLSRSNTLVQELYCIEMLARVDTLCLDKTGTITDGTMKVSDVIEIKNPSEYTIREIIASMLFALSDNNQTAIALQNYFEKNCVLRAVKTLPFSSTRKLSAVSFDDGNTYILGAPEYVIKEKNEKVDERVRRFASQGYRVLALGRVSGSMKDGKIPEGIKPVALITMQDTVRSEAPATIKWFRENDVDVRVISGDNPITVSEVAKRAGIANAEKWISLEGMSSAEVRNVARDYTVFGRVTPEQKLILVKELKLSGRTVAMTGDGVNDILALREADCSIAMAAGSEAARNVSHMVLLDSNFASMPKVVLEGRRVVNNVQKSSSLFLFKTMFCMFLTVFAIISGTKYLFSPSNMLLLEFFVIGLPSMALALEINANRIKGKFIFNVLKNAISGAAVVLINVIIFYIFYRVKLFNVNTFDSFRTLCIYTTTITGIMMLWKMVVPLNTYRGVLMLVVMILVAIVGSFPKSREFIGLGGLMTENIWMLATFALASYPMIAFINNMLSKIRLDRVTAIWNRAPAKTDQSE